MSEPEAVNVEQLRGTARRLLEERTRLAYQVRALRVEVDSLRRDNAVLADELARLQTPRVPHPLMRRVRAELASAGFPEVTA